MASTEPVNEHAHEGPAPGRSRLRAWVLGLVLFALFAGSLGYLVGNERQANTETDGLYATLTLLRHDYAVATDGLARVRMNLRVLDGHVGDDTTALNKDTDQLTLARAALARASLTESDQGIDIGDLQTCLGGVQQALNALSTGNQSGGLFSLSAVSSSCRLASAQGE
jgi:hypothetical protein